MLDGAAQKRRPDGHKMKMGRRLGIWVEAILCAACIDTRGAVLRLVDAGNALEPVGVNAVSVTDRQGGMGGMPADEFCPENQAVIGYEGSLTDVYVVVTPSSGPSITTPTVVVGGLRTLCGSLALGPDGALSTQPGSTLPLRGNEYGMDWTQICPPNEVVVGFYGRSGSYLDQLGIVCARWALSTGQGNDAAAADANVMDVGMGDDSAENEAGVDADSPDDTGVDDAMANDGGVNDDAEGGATVPATMTGSEPWMSGPTTNLGPYGGEGGGPFPTQICGPGLMATGSVLRSGDLIDNFALLCGAPSVIGDSGM
jgi:hypothetical protein